MSVIGKREGVNDSVEPHDEEGDCHCTTADKDAACEMVHGETIK
jgi:hypothetical protein